MTIHVQLKDIAQIEHSRQRSRTNFLSNVVAVLNAYGYRPKKPSLRLASK
jgi:hypothetical protein